MPSAATRPSWCASSSPAAGDRPDAAPRLEPMARLKEDLGMASQNSFNTRTPLTVGGDTFDIFSLAALEKAGFSNVARLPFSLKILLENLLRREDARFVDPE